MSTVLWHADRLMADSQFRKDRERFDALDKVHAFPKPLPIKSTEHNVDDIVHAWVYVGSHYSSKGFAENISKFEDIDNLVAFYRKSTTLNIHTFDNHFEIWLIGEKNHYQFSFESTPLFRVHPHNVSWAMGSGSDAALEAIGDGTNNPVKAMLSAFYQVPTAGGFIECWKFVKSADGVIKSFQRVRIWEPISKEKIPKHLVDMTSDLPGGFLKDIEAYDVIVGILGGDGYSEAEMGHLKRFMLSTEFKNARVCYDRRMRREAKEKLALIQEIEGSTEPQTQPKEETK